MHVDKIFFKKIERAKCKEIFIWLLISQYSNIHNLPIDFPHTKQNSEQQWLNLFMSMTNHLLRVIILFHDACK